MQKKIFNSLIEAKSIPSNCNDKNLIITKITEMTFRCQFSDGSEGEIISFNPRNVTMDITTDFTGARNVALQAEASNLAVKTSKYDIIFS